MKYSRHSAMKLSFSGALASEFVRFRSLRSTWWFMGINAVLFPLGAGLLSALMRFVSTMSVDDGGVVTAVSSPAQIPQALVWNCVTTMGGTCAILLSIFAALSLSSEYSSNSIQMTFVANPRRLSVFWSKGVVAAFFCFVSSLIGVLLAWLTASLVFAGGDVTALETGPAIRLALVSLLGVPLVMSLFSLIGLGIAGIFRSTAMSILGVLTVAYILPTILGIAQIAASSLSWVSSLDSILPTRLYTLFASAGVDTATSATSQALASVSEGWTPSWWLAAVLLVAWAAAFSLIGSFVVRRTDLK